MSSPRLLLLVVLGLPVLPAVCRSAAAAPAVFHLGEVEVVGRRTSAEDRTVDLVPAAAVGAAERPTLAGALTTLPGVTLTSVSGRNELGVQVRGFDLRQVPLFIDGIPVYVPYDGYVDLGRFLTFDLAQVSVAKGFSSTIYGANTLGGAINAVSRRPARALEADFTAGVFSGAGRVLAGNLGGRRGRWYAQGGAAWLRQDYFQLAGGFVPFRASEDGGRRDNSHREDVKVSAKVGYLPNDTDEYAIGFSRQEGEKGTPPYTGRDPLVRARFWRWPQWDKTSVYFIGNTALGADSYVKPRFYFDTFENQLFAYDNATYTTQNLASAFRSIYDDYTWGGSVEWGTKAFARHALKAAAHHKDDVHREHNVGSPQTRFRDRTWSLALEDEFAVSDEFSVVGGISYEGRQSLQAQNLAGTTITDFPGNRNTALNPQLGAFWQLAPGSVFEATVAHKSRLPTLKDRYSYRLGQALPNPALRPEEAWHYELAWRGTPAAGLSVQASVFLSEVADTIQRVDAVAFSGSTALFQLRNVGRSRHRGLEIGGEYAPGRRIKIGGHYTWLERENRSHPAIRPIDTPEHKGWGFVEVKPMDALTLRAGAEYNSARFSTTYGVKVGGYALTHFKAEWLLGRGVSLSAGLNNAFDKHYQLTEGFPEEGRNAFASVTWRY